MIRDDDPDDDGSMKYSWVIAVILCVIAAIVSNFGTNLQKLAWNKRAAIRHEDPGLELHNDVMLSKFRRYWVIGFCCIVVGSLFDFVALGFGAQSVVAPLGSLTLVANMFFAQLLHNEKLTKHDVMATMVILSGCVFSVAFASHKNEIWGLDELMALYNTPRFALYASTIFLILLIGVIFIRYFERIIKVYGHKSKRYKAIFKYHRFSYSFLSGVAGAQSVLFAKSLDELLVGSFNGNSRVFLAHMGSYLIAGGMFVSIFLQIYWLNCALARWDALYVVPVFQAQWIVFSVIGGGVFYKEFDGFSIMQATAFCIGVLLTVVGVYFLSQRGVVEAHVEEGTTMLSVSSRARDSTRSRSRPGSYSDPSGTIERYLLSEHGDLEIGNSLANESLDSPLLALSNTPSLTYTPEPHQFEYDVSFDGAQIGLSVEPYALPVVVRDRTGRRKRRPPLKLWRVRATKHGADHPVKIGHLIVAVNGESVVGPHVRLNAVLDVIANAPRPLVIRFRGNLDHHTHTTALNEEEESQAATQQTNDDTDGEDERVVDNEEDSEIDDGMTRRRRGSTNLQGVALNPLLELIHTWDRTGPRAYDNMVEEEEQASRSFRSTTANAISSVVGQVENQLDLGLDRMVDLVGDIEDPKDYEDVDES